MGALGEDAAIGQSQRQTECRECRKTTQTKRWLETIFHITFLCTGTNTAKWPEAQGIFRHAQ
jgi:hypothetical protein